MFNYNALFYKIYIILWASFTNSFRQWKPSFGVKIILSGFTEEGQWRISAEKAWTQLFLCLTLLNMHL